jgi:GNAT superfamily N-acetyltransferase
MSDRHARTVFGKSVAREHKMTYLPVAVRPAARDSLLLLERHLPYGPPEKHAERLKRQEKGEVVYLVAWHDGTPVGHALLKWLGATEEHLVARFQGTCPDIEDLLVADQYRSRGVATQLLLTIEQLAAERGFQQIGLSVDTQNERARRLYERLGYHSSGLPPHVEQGQYVDAGGRVNFWEEACIYLTKAIDEKGVGKHEA